MIFLDNHSTTAIHPDVVEAMNEALLRIGNPHSTSHISGRLANDELNEAKETIGSYFGVNGDFVVLTSGATEANNLAIRGAAEMKKRKTTSKRRGFISALEHKCVASAAKKLAAEGLELETIPYCEKDGVDLGFLQKNIEETDCFVSIMAANNETSDKLSFLEAADIVSNKDVFFHTDFSQAMYGDPIDLPSSRISAISISGHKFRGPMGIGALVCSRSPNDLVEPILHGGLQEAGVRSGTAPLFLAVGLAKAIELLAESRTKTNQQLRMLVDVFLGELAKVSPSAKVNSKNMAGRPGGVNIYFPGVNAEDLCHTLSADISVSSSAACTGTGINASEILLAMGYEVSRARQSIRICFGENNSPEDAKYAAIKIATALEKLSEHHQD